MHTTMIKDKMLMMANKLGFSPETIKTMEADQLSNKPSEPTTSVTVVAVKKPEEDTMEECCPTLTDEQIDKMSESEAKDHIKKMREYMKEDVKEDSKEYTKEDTKESKPTAYDRIKSLSDSQM